DSPTRLDFASGILERSGIHFRCRYDRIAEPIIIEDGNGDKVQIFALPFVDEVFVRSLYPEEGIKSHQDALEFLLAVIKDNMDPSIPSILTCHAYTGRDPIRSDSERELLVGNQGLVPVEIFEGFDHVAMGHLHRPQVPSRSLNVHYSGSLMPYSFSETGYNKSSIILELAGDHFELEEFHHCLKRGFSCIEGCLDDLLTDPTLEDVRDDYLSIKLTDTGMLMDIHRKLRERFANVLEIDQPALHVNPAGSSSITREQADDPIQLFSLFLDRFGWDEQRDAAVEMFKNVRNTLNNENMEGSS
ncbi:MAG: exonuclease SbcCD subunit D, partial [Candidatus Thermoplasmatota archaeon]|nr:exonuclease SbcCD subunit D [Candidatus Thermoplasmatota archaeon]